MIRVRAYVEIAEEREIEIGAEEILAAFTTEPDQGESWFTVLNRFAESLRALPDDIIASWTASQRKTVHDFLTRQALRFEEPDTDAQPALF